jgi:hypothetical protein
LIDYFITAKREKYGAITHVRVHSNYSGEPSYTSETWTKEAVINLIDNIKKVFYTAFKDGWGNWKTGDRIHTVAGKYLRTDGNCIQNDNLDNLPDF